MVSNDHTAQVLAGRESDEKPVGALTVPEIVERLESREMTAVCEATARNGSPCKERLVRLANWLVEETRRTNSEVQALHGLCASTDGYGDDAFLAHQSGSDLGCNKFLREMVGVHKDSQSDKHWAAVASFLTGRLLVLSLSCREILIDIKRR